MKVLTAGMKSPSSNGNRNRGGSNGMKYAHVHVAADKEKTSVSGSYNHTTAELTTPTMSDEKAPNDNVISHYSGVTNDRNALHQQQQNSDDSIAVMDHARLLKIQHTSIKLDDLYSAPPVIQDTVELFAAEEQYAQQKSKSTEYLWLAICFFGIMGSFVAYGLLLEYATSGGKQLHELSFLFITSLLYTLTASVGRYARAEKPSTIPPAQFAVLGLTSMGSTFFSVRALRYVIYPIQVLAKSCKPVPVMLMGALMGKKYPIKKYLKVALIVAGVGLFMGGG